MRRTRGMTFTVKQKMMAARNEANHRRWIYKRMVADGKKTQQDADTGIAIMAEIEADYRALYEAEEREGRLF